MYYLYVLYSNKNEDFHIGITDNLRQSVREYKQNNKQSDGTLELVFYECFLAESDANRRKQQLNTVQGKKDLKILLCDSIDKARPSCDWQNA